MKKTFLVAALVASIFSLDSFAHRTKGHHIGIDLLGTQIHFNKNTNITSGESYRFKPDTDSRTFGLGASYEYAFNFRRFFVSPGVFFEQDSFGSASAIGSQGTRLQARSRYGLKSDFGYDVTNRIAPYFTTGYSEINYKSRNGEFDITSPDPQNPNLVTAIKTDRTSGWFYGAGVNFALRNNLSLNFEYKTQNYRANTKLAANANSLVTKTYLNARLEVVKVGLVYNF